MRRAIWSSSSRAARRVDRRLAGTLHSSLHACPPNPCIEGLKREPPLQLLKRLMPVNIDLLIAATVAMAGTVVVINRVCWQ